MASLASGLADLFMGSPYSQEQNALGSLAGYESNLGQGALNAGNQYYQDILSGDPAKIAQVLAPEIKAGQGQVEQQALTNANFGNRGGGTNASTQAAQAGERGNIINLIGGLQQGAAGAETGIGMNSLNMGSSNYLNQANLAAARQQQVGQDIGGVAQGAAQIATGFINPTSTLSQDPYQALYNAQHSDTSGLQTSLPESTAQIQ